MGGRVSTNEKRLKIIEWAEKTSNNHKPFSLPLDWAVVNLSLKNYFALASIARNKHQSVELRKQAETLVFRCRSNIESHIVEHFTNLSCDAADFKNILIGGRMFGASKKQGVSLRLALSSCVPTKLCESACYAHDALDASPNSVTRGAINTAIAHLYEYKHSAREAVAIYITRECHKACKAAIKDSKNAEQLLKRRPRVRLAHVGEATSYPNFTNFVAQNICEISDNQVEVVLYTRHPNADKIDTSLVTLLFSLDPSSEDRVSFAPEGSKIVFSGFGGVTSDLAEINFLEHHPHEHFDLSGPTICPVSVKKGGAKSCDEARCTSCFTNFGYK